MMQLPLGKFPLESATSLFHSEAGPSSPRHEQCVHTFVRISIFSSIRWHSTLKARLRRKVTLPLRAFVSAPGRRKMRFPPLNSSSSTFTAFLILDCVVHECSYAEVRRPLRYGVSLQREDCNCSSNILNMYMVSFACSRMAPKSYSSPSPARSQLRNAFSSHHPGVFLT